jgi:hypothetical protein
MKKGKTLTVLVLVIEIASIVILHAVKINQTEKTAAKEVIRNSSADMQENRPKAGYTLTAFK